MSSIKKYISGDTKDWVKFGETNVAPNELSDANNISVDFGNRDSVNSLLYSLQQDIEKLKRNVSWLALHGGGGSGGGSGGGGTIARKASCTITINESTRAVSITEGQTVNVVLSNFKGTTTTTPWKINITFDGTGIYTGSKALGSLTEIQIPIVWTTISRFFEGSGRTKNHSMVVSATYSDEETLIDGSAALEAYVYIPIIECSITTKDRYNVDDGVAELTASITIDTALTGYFVLKVTSLSYNLTIEYSGFEFNKTSNVETYEIENFIDAFKKSGVAQYGVYTSTFDLYNRSSATRILQKVYTTSRKIVIFSNAVDLLVNFDGLSPDPTEDKRTTVYDNVKNLFFSFYAFKNNSSTYTYSILMYDNIGETGTPIDVVNSSAAFDSVVSINKIVNELQKDKLYTVVLTITPDIGDVGKFRGYVKCIEGQFTFIKYSNDSEYNRLFSIDSFNYALNSSGIASTMMLTAATSDPTKIGTGNPVSTDISFFLINPRSGLITDSTNKKSLLLYDTYLNIDNKFSYTVQEGSTYKVNSTNILNNKQFTICLCYSTLTYVSNEHVVFSLCNNGYVNQGIVVKTDGVYVKNKKVLTVYGDKVVTLHIIYDNSSSETTNKWGSKSYYKIYVNGVITYMSDSCPFQVQEVSHEEIIQNDNLKIYLNGYSEGTTGNRKEQCNCNIYDVEIFKGIMNEIDILGSYVNNKIRTTYKDSAPDFDILEKELNKNCCTYDVTKHIIRSDMYPVDGVERKFVFNNILLDSSGEVPSEEDTEKKQQWISKLSSLSLPITYIDLKDSSSPSLTAWTFLNFVTPGTHLQDVAVTTKFYYWDPTTGEMPISSDSVELKVQGTSTLEDKVKNVLIKFNSFESGGKIVQDLLFVREDWIPENSYVLKADVVDSSHANNASIGRFINEQFLKDNSFGFGFDDGNIASKNITLTTTALKDTLNWNISPMLKHTVEGFLTLLLIRFYSDDTTDEAYKGFINLGIYSFNIGRNAARNLGFEYIQQITDEESTPLTAVTAPTILKNVIVNNLNEDQIFWVENSNTQNFNGVSAWTAETNTIEVDNTITDVSMGDGSNPSYQCRFWHCLQGTDDTKLNQLFEVKYNNTLGDIVPSNIPTFVRFVDQVSKLPIEGMLKTTALDYSLPLIVGSYKTWKYTGTKWTLLAPPHNLKAEALEPADVNTFDPTLLASYFVISLLFGLVDNLDKNISFRIFGNSKLLADFYDMDTALGLNNAGLEDVAPTVGMKLVFNTRNALEQDYPQETLNLEKIVKNEKYDKYLPETYTNKLWLSLDSNSMRIFNGISYSLYSDLWFKLRQYLDAKAAEKSYNSVVDFFVDEYFSNQVNCGTFIYNYDYTMKYLNDFKQSGEKQSNNTISKLHGRRIDEVREWLREHIDFLDSYFFWRGKCTYTNGSKVVPKLLNTVVANKVSITSSSNNNLIDIETLHPVIVHSSSTADGDEVGDTLTIDGIPLNIKVSGGGTDKAMALNCSSLLKNFDLVSLGAKRFRAQDGAKITFLEELILDGLTIVADGISMDDFIGSSTDVNVMSKISMNLTKFSLSFSLDLNLYLFLNVSYVDIKNSTNVNLLRFYQSPYSSDTTTLNLKYLNVEGSQIENLNLRYLSYLVLPNIDKCDNLVTFKVQDCNLDNIDGTRTALSNYLNINLSSLNSINEVTIQNTEHIKSIAISQCPLFLTLYLDGVSALTALTLNYNLKLENVTIKNCPLLQTIKITQCHGFSDIEVLSAPSLTALDLEYDTSLTALKISKDSVKNIRTINLRNVDISGFNFYNYGTKTYDSITIDPRGNKVLDFADFESLNSNGITIRKMATGEKSSDKCANFQAIRFPNKPEKSYLLLDRNTDNIGVRFTNLKNIYGHILTVSNGEIAGDTQFFLNNGDYKGYPPFISQFLKNASGNVDTTLLRTSTFFDKIEEKCSTIGAKLSGKSTLEDIEGYILNGFLQCAADGISEFDNRPWATNYTVPSLNWLFHTKGLSEFDLQYLFYRYAIYKRNDLISGAKTNFHLLATYAPTNRTEKPNIEFPTNTFKFFGRTISEVRSMFLNTVGSSRFVITSKIMKWLPHLSWYAGFANNDILFWNALSGNSSTLTKLGNVDNSSNYSSSANAVKMLSSETLVGNYDYGPALISTLTSLLTVVYFLPELTNFHLSGCLFPASLQELGNSFTKCTAAEVIDIGYAFLSCSNMRRFYNSFGNALTLIKPSSLHSMPMINLILFNNTKKILVEDRITLDNYLDSYDDDSGNYYIRNSYPAGSIDDCTQYTHAMFTLFVNNILTANTLLTSTNYLLANITIPYKNIIEQDYVSLPLNKNLLKYNTKLESLQNFFSGQQFTYTVVSGMFENLTAITNMYAAFANIPSLSRGISSCIPYKFLYTGMQSDYTATFVGTNRFDHNIASYTDFKNYILNSFTPTRMVAGVTSYDWNSLSTSLWNTGLLDAAAFNDVKSTYLGGGSGYVNLPTLLTSYEDYCPLARYVDDGSGTLTVLYTAGGTALVKTLSTIYKHLSSNLDGWEQHVVDLSTATNTYHQYRRTIANVNYLLSGNVNILPYNGATVTEPNSEYNPFKLNYDASNNRLLTNLARNNFLLDDQWSHNGGIWNATADDWEVVNYDPTHNNATTPALSVLSSNGYDVHDLSGTGMEIIYNNVDSYRKSSFYNAETQEIDLVEYLLFKDQVQEFKYICASDLFRYCVDGLLTLTYVFARCDNFCNSASMNYQTNRRTLNLKGLTGRIPPNLLKPISTVKDITGLFKQCYHVTGYQGKDDDGNIRSYLIPADFFKEANTVNCFKEAFYGMSIKYNPDFEKPFSMITIGSSFNGTKIDFTRAFARCIWCDVNYIIRNILVAKYFSSIDSAFENTLGTVKNTVNNRYWIVNNGATIGALPTMNVFTNTKYLPATISRTYFGSIYNWPIYSIADTDVAKRTLTDPNEVHPGL